MYLTDEATLDRWRAEGAAALPKVRQHSWNLFEYLVLHSDAPRWSGWQTEQDVVNSLPNCANGQPAPGKAAAVAAPESATSHKRLFHGLHTPEQLVVGASVARVSAVTTSSKPEFSFVAINPATATYLRKMMQETGSCNLQASLERQLTHPLQPDRDGNRKVPELPRTAVVIKAIWELIPGPSVAGGTVNLHVWDPANPQLQAANPDKDEVTAPLSLWRSTVPVNIDRSASAPKCNGDADYTSGPVPLACFFSVPVEKADLDQFEGQTQNIVSDPNAPNNFPFNLVLIGFHVMTRETKNWTWQTFYWSNKALTADKPGTHRTGDLTRHDGNPWKKTGAAQWSHYVMDASLSADTPHEADGKAVVCFNPYLEGARTHGLVSNCQGCHQYARYNHTPNQLAGYQIAEQARSNPPTKAQLAAYTANTLDTSFLWSLAEVNRPR